ncbi:MAG: CdaR family protein [Candidatus Promineifilaceae bacterium]
MSTARSILYNLGTFLIALLLAVLVWAAAILNNDPVETRLWQIDVQTIGLPPDAQLLSRPPNTASITIEGPVSALDKVSPNDYTAVIDLSGVSFGETDVDIQIEGGIEGVAVLNKSPETARINMEQIVTRDIPVRVDVRGEVARGHRKGQESVSPEFVQVTGIASLVNQLAEARVTVFLDNARQDVDLLRRPTFYDLQGNVASNIGLTVTPSEVQVVVPVIELAGFAEKPITVNWVGEPASGYRLLNINVEPSSILITAPPDQLDALRIETEPVDISGLTISETLQVALDLPDGVSLEDPQPIIVTVEIGPIQTSDVVQRPVEVRGLGEGLEAILDPEEVRVFLFGPLPVLESLEDDDVRVTLDLLNLEIGTYSLEPLVSISANRIVERSIQPATVTVVITEAMTTTEDITGTLPVTATSLLPPDTGATSGGVANAGATGSACHLFCLAAVVQVPFAILNRRMVVI